VNKKFLISVEQS